MEVGREGSGKGKECENNLRGVPVSAAPRATRPTTF